MGTLKSHSPVPFKAPWVSDEQSGISNYQEAWSKSSRCPRCLWYPSLEPSAVLLQWLPGIPNQSGGKCSSRISHLFAKRLRCFQKQFSGQTMRITPHIHHLSSFELGCWQASSAFFKVIVQVTVTVWFYFRKRTFNKIERPPFWCYSRIFWGEEPLEHPCLEHQKCHRSTHRRLSRFFHHCLRQKKEMALFHFLTVKWNQWRYCKP